MSEVLPVTMTGAGREAFILAHTSLLPVAYVPALRLYVAQEATELWQKTEDQLGEIGLPPPFWAFAWAGGQGLARYVLDHADLLEGKRVLDFASGSGLVAIAAAKAGASRVEACDIDAFAVAAIHLNAVANDVALEVSCEDLIGSDRGWDVILAGDICYERALATRVTTWLAQLAARGARVLIGDPGRAYLPRERLTELARGQVPVTRALEDADIRLVCVYQLNG